MSLNNKTADAFRKLAKARHSCRRFQPNVPIPKDVLQDVLETTLTSPSGFNIQPTNVILLQNQKIKEKLGRTAMLGPGNVYRTIDSSVMAVFLSDLQPHKRLDRIVELEKESSARTKEYISTLPIVATFLTGEGKVATMMKQFATDIMSPVQPMPTIDNVQAWSYKNSSLMAQTFALAATSHGLDTCFMEGYDSRRVKDVLRIPDRYDIPLMCGVGYEYQEKGEDAMQRKRNPRLPMNEVFFSDLFGNELEINHSSQLDKSDGESFSSGTY